MALTAAESHAGRPPAPREDRLVLFMTAGMGLIDWERSGSYEREVALYRRLRPMLGGLTIVTYGGPEDLAFRRRLPGIDVVCNRYRLPERLYRAYLLRLVATRWRGRRVVVKTNQTQGSDVALAAAQQGDSPLIARCGYLLSDFASREHDAGSSELEAARALEKRVFSAAARVVVTTESMKHAVAGYGVPDSRISVIPNYVDTKLFAPRGGAQSRTGDLISIGRLDGQKNLFALLDAVDGLPVELSLVGEGSQRRALEAQAAQLSAARVHFLGYRAHGELPGLIRSARLYVQASLYEGHPKALIEAMACAAPVVATDVPGIRDIIRHRKTGYLCSPSPSALREAIETVLGDPELAEEMGRNARRFVLANYPLERIVEMELQVIGAVIYSAG